MQNKFVEKIGKTILLQVSVDTERHPGGGGGYIAGYYTGSKVLENEELKVFLSICPNINPQNENCWADGRKQLQIVLLHEVGHAVWKRQYRFPDGFKDKFLAYIEEHPPAFSDTYRSMYADYYSSVYSAEEIEEEITEEIFAESFALWILDQNVKLGKQTFRRLSPEFKELFQENLGGNLEKEWLYQQWLEG